MVDYFFGGSVVVRRRPAALDQGGDKPPPELGGDIDIRGGGFAPADGGNRRQAASRDAPGGTRLVIQVENNWLPWPAGYKASDQVGHSAFNG